MQRHNVDGLNFDFPDDWQVSKYDDWSYYRNQFAKMWNGIKSLDLLAVDPVQTAWLIEVKDYRVNQRTKPSKLRPQAINPADLKQKIRQLLKPVDAHPIVVGMTTMGALGWNVSH